MASTDLCSNGPSFNRASSQKRKRSAPEAHNPDSLQKKQKTKPRGPRTRANSKRNMESNNIMDPASNMANDSNAPKPANPTPSSAILAPPAGQPPISSDIRAGLCDTIQFWRAHQGGIQSNDKVATGMLLNGKTTPRDVLQAQVIITTVGGGLKTAADGKHIRTGDQEETNKNYVTLRNAMDLGQPIGVVVGKQAADKGNYANNLLSIELDHHYNVLDWFFITDMWPERQPTQRDGTSYTHYVVRLQLIELGSMSWWVPQSNKGDNVHAVGEFHCRTITCQSCNTPSKEIFKEGWCCLAKTCPEFFRFSAHDVDTDTLQYNEDFLNERMVWKSERSSGNLVPDLPILKGDLYGSESQFKRGIMCPKCKFASRRISWGGWECENGCGFKLMMPPRDVPMALIDSEAQDIMKKKAKAFEVDDRIQNVKHDVAGYDVTSFYLPNTPEHSDGAEFIGSVTVFRPNKSTLERNGGLNELFNEIQEATRIGDVKLRRHPAFCRGSHMEELTSHFSCNMGADYKFGVVVETSGGFETAPAPVMKALSRLTWGGATAVALTADHISQNGLSVDPISMPDSFIDFNEQLMLGYFEGSQISFHDDGEKELGPTVATLSLGSPSIMRFRGKKKSGFFDAGTKGERVMLSFILQHGDIVIMHGTKIHQHYEHSVVAAGIRRYALTCRYIRPEIIPDAERREKAVVNGKVPVYWQKKAYKGEPTEASK